MFSFLKRWSRSRQHAQRVKANLCPKLDEMPYEEVRSDETPSWPPVKDKVEFISIQDMFRTQAVLIKNLMDSTGLTAHEKELYLLPVLTNVAKWCHLLPASEYMHHQGKGGLFRHSLQVGLFCANKTKLTNFAAAINPKDIELNRKRWVFTGMLTGLLHDIGKAISDMEITCEGKRWQHAESLVDWLLEIDADSYVVSFIPNRARKSHCEMSHALVKTIVPEATVKFLNAGGFGDHLMDMLNKAILHGSEGGALGKILIACDSLSVREDIEHSRQIPARYKSVSHPQADGLLKAIRVLINNEEKWKVNCPTGRVFISREGCFVEWESGSTEAYAQASQELGFSNLPNDPLRLATILVDAGVAVADKENVEGESIALWSITPIDLNLLTPTGPRKEQRKITAVRIADASLIFDATTPPPRPLVIDGRRVSPEVAAAFEAECGFIPKSRITTQEMQRLGYTEELIASEINRNITEGFDAEGNLELLVQGPDATVLDHVPPPEEGYELPPSNGSDFAYADLETADVEQGQSSDPATGFEAQPAASSLDELLSGFSPAAAFREAKAQAEKPSLEREKPAEVSGKPVVVAQKPVEVSEKQVGIDEKTVEVSQQTPGVFSKPEVENQKSPGILQKNAVDFEKSIKPTQAKVVLSEAKTTKPSAGVGPLRQRTAQKKAQKAAKNAGVGLNPESDDWMPPTPTLAEVMQRSDVGRIDITAATDSEKASETEDADLALSLDPSLNPISDERTSADDDGQKRTGFDECFAQYPGPEPISEFAEMGLDEIPDPDPLPSEKPVKVLKTKPEARDDFASQFAARQEEVKLELPDVRAAGVALRAKMLGAAHRSCLGTFNKKGKSPVKAASTVPGSALQGLSPQSKPTKTVVADIGPAPTPWDDFQDAAQSATRVESRTSESAAQVAPASKAKPVTVKKDIKKPAASSSRRTARKPNANAAIKELLDEMVSELRSGHGELIEEIPILETDAKWPTVSAMPLLERASEVGFSVSKLGMAISQYRHADGALLKLNELLKRVSLIEPNKA